MDRATFLFCFDALVMEEQIIHLVVMYLAKIGCEPMDIERAYREQVEVGFCFDGLLRRLKVPDDVIRREKPTMELMLRRWGDFLQQEVPRMLMELSQKFECRLLTFGDPDLQAERIRQSSSIKPFIRVAHVMRQQSIKEALRTDGTEIVGCVGHLPSRLMQMHDAAPGARLYRIRWPLHAVFCSHPDDGQSWTIIRSLGELLLSG